MSQNRKVDASTSAAAFPSQVHNAEPSDKSWCDRHLPSLSQHLLQFTITDAIFTVPADGPQDNMTLKMPTSEWVHVLLLQLNSGISLPSSDLCNSAPLGLHQNSSETSWPPAGDRPLFRLMPPPSVSCRQVVPSRRIT